jgi:predicted DNA-binding protein (MmcQ/YjbR family)
MNKKHWNTIDLTGDLPMSEVFRLVDHSYDLIVKKLPKAVKQRFRILHERCAQL